ncbi:MAG: hypothetical protein ACK4NC_02720 [Candidatus Gracilibacteria bacterium]
MKRHLEKIHSHYKTHKEKLLQVWEEKPLTRTVTIAVFGISIVVLGGFIRNAYEAKQVPSNSTSTISVSQEAFEDLHFAGTINKNTNHTISATGVKQPVISSPIAKSTPVYGVENTLRLEQDIQTTLKQQQSTKAIESIISSSNRLDPIYTDSTDLVTKHIEILRIMRSYLSVNLITLMNGSPNREQVLDSFFDKLKNAQTTIQASTNELNSEIARLKDEYGRHESAKKTASTNFANKLANLDANGTNTELSTIIKEEQQAAEFYTRYRSFEKIRNIYAALTKPINTKLTVISANREALIKGVQVVAVPGMQEDLILTEKQWRDLINR